MNEERMKILKMLEEGKLSVEEAAKLIRAVESSQETEQEEPPQWLRIRVIEDGEEKFKLNLPLSLVRTAVKFIPESIQEKMEEEGLDIEEILRESDVHRRGKLVEVEDETMRIEIYVE